MLCSLEVWINHKIGCDQMNPEYGNPVQCARADSRNDIARYFTYLCQVCVSILYLKLNYSVEGTEEMAKKCDVMREILNNSTKMYFIPW